MSRNAEATQALRVRKKTEVSPSRVMPVSLENNV